MEAVNANASERKNGLFLSAIVSFARTATWRQRHVEVQTNQSETSYTVNEVNANTWEIKNGVFLIAIVSLARAATWRQRHVEVQTSQSEAWHTVRGHMFAISRLRCFEESTKCVCLNKRYPRCLHEASWSFVEISWSSIVRTGFRQQPDNGLRLAAWNFFHLAHGRCHDFYHSWLSLAVFYWVVSRFFVELFLRKFHSYNRTTST